MNKQSILVTGGAGFIGSHVVDKLLERGERVLVIDDLNDYYDPNIKKSNLASHTGKKNFRFFEGDITDFEFLARTFKENQVSHIIHLAARAGVRSSIQNPALYEKVNVLGTLNLLEVARIYGVKNFIFGSSSSVYGNRSETPFRENVPADAQISPYGATKRMAELLIYTHHYLYKINSVCLRFFTVYGERGRPDMAPYLFTESLIKNGEISMFGDGKTSRDYTHVEDIVRGILKCLDKDFGYEIINLGNHNPISLSQFVEILEEITGIKAKIITLPKKPGDVETTYADISKAQQLLDWEPKIGIYEGMKRYVEWHKLFYFS
ncbi:MAG: GDP-mannose 4,6-dehydratase [Patescibacteria group bacterium]